ncbi:MAG TPA: PAS domain-containing protein [Puia sp.]|uniref:hybrid sensor histidine kinase/response regulator n=1 Tax=Puia sp. TaxID=2045100 RepID=UPI002C699764|nr:PAS domain-containing protein [Puia sp.]HVU97059.1 PAS domain-containing protein [Puia sp.]
MNNGLSILTVEDNPSDLFLLEHMIRSSGLSLRHFYSTDRIREAYALLAAKEIDLVLLDLTLPDSFGIHSFIYLKPVVQKIPVIILTGLSDTNVALEAIKEGAQDYLVKGELTESLLAKAIQYSLERKRTLEHLRLSNERFNTVVKATNDAIWDWDLVTNTVFMVGDTYKQLFGYDWVDSDIPQDHWESILHPDDRARVLEKQAAAIREGVAIKWEDEYRLRKRSGEYAHVHDRGYIMYSAEHRPVRMIGAIQDITLRKRAEEIVLKELAIQQRLKQQQITEVVLGAQERERFELGQELHDNINQILATCRLYLDVAIEEREPRLELLVKSRNNISMAIEEIRRLSKELITPSLNDLGLVQSIQELVRNIQMVGKMKIRLAISGLDENALLPEQKINVYRIIQEQLNNILKHAQAHSVMIELTKEEEQIRLLVVDDGRGFDPRMRRDGVGISNIISRAELYNGKVDIDSAPGKGCRLEVILNSKALPTQA